MTPRRPVAGGPPEGRRPAPRQRRVLAAELRGHRRGGPARQARSRGRRVRRGRGRRSGARRGPRGGRRAHRVGRFRRRLHHRRPTTHSTSCSAAGPANAPLACLPGEYGPNLAVMAANGFDVSALPVDDARPSRRRRRRPAPWPPIRPRWCTSPRWPATAGSSSRWRSSPRCAATSACRWWSTPLRRWDTSTARSVPPPSTARHASGWRARGASACWRSVPSSRSG